MSNDNDILTALQLHDDGLQANNDVAIGFAATVTVVVFVFVAGGEVFGVFLGDFFIGEAIADARVQLI